MRILIADDESLARERLRALLAECPGSHTVVAEAERGDQVITRVLEHDADVVLLDVRMPGMDGLEVAELLADMEPPPAVVLVTAYPDFALDAFKFKVADYLVKPVRRERLCAALEKLSVITRPQRLAAAELNTPRPPPDPNRRRHLSAHYRGGVQTVPINNILYLLAEQKYVTVRHLEGRMLVDESLKALEEEFADRFMRIHRNALVMTERLIGLERGPEGVNMAVLKGCEERLAVSRRHLPDVRRFLRYG